MLEPLVYAYLEQETQSSEIDLDMNVFILPLSWKIHLQTLALNKFYFYVNSADETVANV